MPATSQAHFVLTSPPAMYDQNALGDPQKAAPCGDQGNAVPTGIVTAYNGGDTITVTIDETIFHPGHYRIALALDDGIFPEEPPVTPGSTDCGSAPIDPAPAFPVLADGIWVHTDAFDGSQSFDITLPDDVSCTNCTLQVIQFMSNHAERRVGRRFLRRRPPGHHRSRRHRGPRRDRHAARRRQQQQREHAHHRRRDRHHPGHRRRRGRL
jgi:hypothetical protein